MRKNLRRGFWAIAAALLFSVVVGSWSAHRLLQAASDPKPLGELRAIADAPLPENLPASPTGAAPASSATAMPSPTAGTTMESTPSTATPAPATPTAATSRVPSAPAATNAPPVSAAATSPPAPPQPTASGPAELDPAVEIAMQHALEQQGKLFLAALQAGDAGRVQSMLGARCQGVDVSALIAQRQAQIEAQAGVPIAEITPLTTYVGHLDAAAGEAHTVLQWVAGGQRMSLLSADGWLYEGGQWKNVTC